MKKKSLLIPTIFMMVGVTVLCTLGTWQMHRLAWKDHILRKLDAEYEAQPRLIDVTQIPADVVFKRGFLRGRFLEGAIMVGPRTHEGQVGKHFYAPFQIASGKIIFVNKGWVPADFSLMVEDGSSKTQSINGILKPPGERNQFTPPNDAEKGLWYAPDPQAMAQSLEINTPVMPYIFMLETKSDNAAYPIPQAEQLRPNNNHLQYAIFWYALACAMVVIYALRFLRKS